MVTEDLRQLAEEALDCAETMRLSLETVFASQRLNLAHYATLGCLCCDVGHGAEIHTFMPFRPARFVATEGVENRDEKIGINASLAALGQQYPAVEIIRESPTVALKSLTQKQPLSQFGLITHLYTFPQRIQDEYWETFYTEQDKLLLPEGAVVASWQWEEPDSGNPIGMIMEGFKVLRPLGYTIYTPDIPGGSSSGGIFVIGVKPKG